eukprot:jgi/Psemu1/309561/fgenesh1_kg.526_\
MNQLSQVTKRKKEVHPTGSCLPKSDDRILRAAFNYRPVNSLPPSLMQLPQTSSRKASILQTALDEFLKRIDTTPQTQTLNEEQSVAEVTASESIVSSVPSTSSLSSLTSLSSSSSSKSKSKPKRNLRVDVQTDINNDNTPGFPPRQNKRRRFERRNSFLVRDLAQLSRIAEQSTVGGGSQEI